MARVSNRQILEAVATLASEMTEAVAPSTYPDPLVPATTLDRGEYYGVADVTAAAARCYQLYHHNPLVRRAVDLRAQYVWGRGVTLMSPQPAVDAAIREFLDRNARELGHQGRAEKDRTLSLEGNLFFRCDTDADGAVTVRMVPMAEITETRRDPDDYRTIWYWKRTTTVYEKTGAGVTGAGKEVSVYHPALGYEPASRPTAIDDIPVRWDQPVLHAPLPRIGKEVFAMPPFTAALPWATAYSHFLSNIASIAASLARFTWRATAKTPAGAKKVREVLDLGTGNITAPGGERQATGAAFVSTDGVAIEPIRTSGVSTGADEGRRFALMVASGTDTPEHMLMGDPSTGNLATTRTMERPFELAILDRQLWWADVLEALLAHAITCRVRAKDYAPLAGEVAEDEFGRTLILVDVTDEDGRTGREEAKIVVEFPSVLEHDMVAEVAAIIDMATLKGAPLAGVVDRATLRRMLLSALNAPDVDDLIANLDQDDLDAQAPPEPEPEPEPPAFLQPPPLPETARTEEALGQVAEALREVVRAAEVRE